MKMCRPDSHGAASLRLVLHVRLRRWSPQRAVRCYPPLAEEGILGLVVLEASLPIQAEPRTLLFSGPLKIKESTPGATFDGVQINDLMRGSFTIGATAEGASFSPPGSYLFPTDLFHGLLVGDGMKTSTRGSSKPLEGSGSRTASRLSRTSWMP
jgi:hypothetical protein